jgi:glucose/arabinose dehydrogenase
MRWIRTRGSVDVARTLAWLVAALLCAETGRAQPLSSEPVGAGFDAPMYVTHAPGLPGLLFVAERAGIIRAVDLATGATLTPAFLDIAPLVITSFERGLLGLAFHPDFEANGHFYVHYSDTAGDSQISEFTATLDPLVAPAESERPILTVVQPQGNHNGGWVAFSPIDGLLYIALGDGGGSNDSGTGHTEPNGNAQDITNNLLGKILRLDVDGDADDFPADASRNYAIPPDNPFVGVVGDDEIWAYGLRNPFRAGFDRETGDLWIGDVGQSAREEVDFQPADSPGGENYGWRLREGTIATPGDVGGARPPGNVDPVFDYPRSPGGAIIGGTVYRGPVAALRGRYVFGDISSRVWSFDPADPDVTLIEHTSELGSIQMPVAFGEDAAGELYVVSLAGGVHRIVPEPGAFASSAVALAALFAMGQRRRLEGGYPITPHDAARCVVRRPLRRSE